MRQGDEGLMNQPEDPDLASEMEKWESAFAPSRSKPSWYLSGVTSASSSVPDLPFFSGES